MIREIIAKIVNFFTSNNHRFENKETSNENKEKMIDLKNLYISVLGVVESDGGNCRWSPITINPCVIVEVEDMANNHYGIDIFTKSKYYFFNSPYTQELINKVALGKAFPLSLYLTNDEVLSGKISIDRVKEVIHSFNNPEEKKEEEIHYPKDKDYMMERLLKLASMTKMITSEESKERITLEINNLATYYVEELIKLKFDQSLDMSDKEQSLVNDCLGKLLLIEQDINKEINNNLLDDLFLLHRNIGSEMQ